jgi:hypothetical protein
VDNIIALAAKQAESLAVETRQSLKEHIERRIKLAEEKIARAEMEAVGELRNDVVDLAIAAADCQAHPQSSQEARLREHQGTQDLAKVTTACPAPFEAATWPSQEPRRHGGHREALTQARCTQKACCAHAPYCG